MTIRQVESSGVNEGRLHLPNPGSNELECEKGAGLIPPLFFSVR